MENLQSHKDTARPQLRSLRFSQALPLILQRHPMQCGIACAAMVGAYFGLSVPLDELDAKHPVGRRGLSVASVAHILVGMGFYAAPIECAVDHLRTLPDPCILHVMGGHFVVLRRATFQRAYIHDPAKGAYTVSIDALARQYQGCALVVFPGEGTRSVEPALIRLSF